MNTYYIDFTASVAKMYKTINDFILIGVKI